MRMVPSPSPVANARSPDIKAMDQTVAWAGAPGKAPWRDRRRISLPVAVSQRRTSLRSLVANIRPSWEKASRLTGPVSRRRTFFPVATSATITAVNSPPAWAVDFPRHKPASSLPSGEKATDQRSTMPGIDTSCLPVTVSWMAIPSSVGTVIPIASAVKDE